MSMRMLPQSKSKLRTGCCLSLCIGQCIDGSLNQSDNAAQCSSALPLPTKPPATEQEELHRAMSHRVWETCKCKVRQHKTARDAQAVQQYFIGKGLCLFWRAAKHRWEITCRFLPMWLHPCGFVWCQGFEIQLQTRSRGPKRWEKERRYLRLNVV